MAKTYRIHVYGVIGEAEIEIKRSSARAALQAALRQTAGLGPRTVVNLGTVDAGGKLTPPGRSREYAL